MTFRKQIQFPKSLVFYFLECRTMEEVQKSSNSEFFNVVIFKFWNVKMECLKNKINEFAKNKNIRDL
jgi:hypothetical protein